VAQRRGHAVSRQSSPTPDEITRFCEPTLLASRTAPRFHHHPFEVLESGRLFRALGGYFAPLTHKGEGISPPISGAKKVVFAPKRLGDAPDHEPSIATRPLFGPARAIDPAKIPGRRWPTGSRRKITLTLAQLCHPVWPTEWAAGRTDPVTILGPPTRPAIRPRKRRWEGRSASGYDINKLNPPHHMTSYVYAVRALRTNARGETAPTIRAITGSRLRSEVSA